MDSLTEREKVIYQFLTTGKYRSYKEISTAMGVDRIDVHIPSMRDKGVWFLVKLDKKDSKKKLFKIKLWSAKNNLHCCSKCGRLDVKHKGHGLCLNCFDKKRAEKPDRKQQLKQQHDRWYKRVKGTPEYKEYTNERAKVWRDTSPAYIVYLNKCYREGRALRKALNKQNREAWRSGVYVTCDCCGKKYQTPYTSEYLQDNFREFRDYKKYMEYKHQGLL